MKLQTNKAQYVSAYKWSKLCKCKKMKYTMQPQTNEEHYATPKKIKLTIKPQRNEAHYATIYKYGNYATANKWSTICNHYQLKTAMHLQTNET